LAVTGGDYASVDSERSSRCRAGASEFLFHRLFLESQRLFLAERLALGHPLVEVELGPDDDRGAAGTEDRGQKRGEVLGEERLELAGLAKGAASHSSAGIVLACDVVDCPRVVGNGHDQRLTA